MTNIENLLAITGDQAFGAAVVIAVFVAILWPKKKEAPRSVGIVGVQVQRYSAAGLFVRFVAAFIFLNVFSLIVVGLMAAGISGEVTWLPKWAPLPGLILLFCGMICLHAFFPRGYFESGKPKNLGDWLLGANMLLWMILATVPLVAWGFAD